MAEIALISGFRQKTIVWDGGKIEIVAPNLPQGVRVEVIVFVEPVEQDTTEYLLSTEANRQHLQKAMEDLQDRTLYTIVDLDEFEEHCLSASSIR